MDPRTKLEADVFARELEVDTTNTESRVLGYVEDCMMDLVRHCEAGYRPRSSNNVVEMHVWEVMLISRVKTSREPDGKDSTD